MHRSRVHSPGLPRCRRHPADARRKSRRSSPTLDPTSGRKLIDALLDRPEFVDYWAYKWSDLLLVSSRKLPQPAMWAFYRSSARPSPTTSRGTASPATSSPPSGSTLDNGAANYFVLHKDVADLTESTAVTFLGMSVTCCRCHNHPLEKWTQDQYWALANLFCRVGLKNGDRAGEVIGAVAARRATCLHPRRGVAMPPTPLDGKPLPLDSPRDRRAVLRRLADGAGQPVLREGAGQPRLAELHGPRPGRGRGRPPRRPTRPTNRELLDALAKDFVAHDYDVKHLIRTIMNSAAYQRSSVPAAGQCGRRSLLLALPRPPAAGRGDPRRLLAGDRRADAVHQGLTGAAGGGGRRPTKLTRSARGPCNCPTRSWRRASSTRSAGPTASRPAPANGPQDASVGQALHLNNGHTLNDKLRDKNAVVSQWLVAKLSATAIVDRVFLAGCTAGRPRRKRRASPRSLAEAAKAGSNRAGGAGGFRLGRADGTGVFIQQVRLEMIFVNAGDTPARGLTLFALLGLGIIDSLASGLMSATEAVQSFFHAGSCLFVRQRVKDKVADRVMSQSGRSWRTCSTRCRPMRSTASSATNSRRCRRRA